MFRKLMLGVAAAAAMATVSLAPTSASAHGFKSWHGGWGHHNHFRQHFAYSGYGYGGGCTVTRRVWTPYGYAYRTVNICY